MVKNIVLIGLKSSGKSSVGRLLAAQLDCVLIDTDKLIEQNYLQQTGNDCGFSEIYKRLGAQRFRALERQVVADISAIDKSLVISTGGGVMLDQRNVSCLSANGFIVYLQAGYKTLLERWRQSPPAFIDSENIEQELQLYYEERSPMYSALADVSLNVDDKNLQTIVNSIIDLLKD